MRAEREALWTFRRWKLRTFIFGCISAGYVLGFGNAKGWF